VYCIELNGFKNITFNHRFCISMPNNGFRHEYDDDFQL